MPSPRRSAIATGCSVSTLRGVAKAISCVRRTGICRTYISDIRSLLALPELVEVDWIGTSLGGSLGMLISGDEGAVARSLVLNDIGP